MTPSPALAGSPTRIALLRGINVGGHRKVPMAALRTLLGEHGFNDAATYIQSGNVVFSDGPPDDGVAEVAISTAIREHFGFEVPVCVRSADELRRVLARSGELFPPGDGSVAAAAGIAHVKRVHIAFLSAAPEQQQIDAIDPNRSPGDVAVVEGRELHLSYGKGAGSTKLTGDYLERVLGVSITARNLATVAALINLAT